MPTPAIVAPIEFTHEARDDYQALGGHMAEVRPVESVRGHEGLLPLAPLLDNPWPLAPEGAKRSHG